MLGRKDLPGRKLRELRSFGCGTKILDSDNYSPCLKQSMICPIQDRIITQRHASEASGVVCNEPGRFSSRYEGKAGSEQTTDTKAALDARVYAGRG